MIIAREQLIFTNSLKFNDTRIERFELNEIDIIYFKQKIHIQDIQLIQSIDIITTSARDKLRIKLITRKQYVTQRAREVYLCWFISTMMIRSKSVYCMWSLLIDDDTYHWSSYLLSDLYVGSVGHVTHINPIRSGYYQPTWLVNLLVRHWDHFKKVVKPCHQPGYSIAIALSHSVVYSLFILCRIVHEYHWLIDSLIVSLVDSLPDPLID
jgi:hypothetical protein